jgi:hypothetical protein
MEYLHEILQLCRQGLASLCNLTINISLVLILLGMFLFFLYPSKLLQWNGKAPKVQDLPGLVYSYIPKSDMVLGTKLYVLYKHLLKLYWNGSFSAIGLYSKAFTNIIYCSL